MEKSINLPAIFLASKKDNTAVFEIEPLFSGYGVTLGNSLRRVLLSSLPGAAITSVKIEGVQHEFSSLPHVKEDVVQIILALKQLRLKLLSDEPQKLVLEARGPGKITADKINKNAKVEIINPDLQIATIDSREGKLNMEMTVETGLGYVPTEAREEEKRELGEIAIDALFTPVTHVKYEVLNTRVGEATDFDKLILEVTTDGTISPEEALRNSAQILVDQFNTIAAGEFMKEKPAKVKAERVSEVKEEISIEELNLSTRATNALLNNEIKTVGDVLAAKDKLPTLKGLGAKALTEIVMRLREIGIELFPATEVAQEIKQKEKVEEKPVKPKKKVEQKIPKKPIKKVKPKKK
jgi:DNA-directed RNA polymerase subunit alpha